MELVATGKSATFRTPKTAFQLGIHQLSRLNLNRSHDSPFESAFQFPQFATQMPLKMPHWFSSKNCCQLTFKHHARLQVLCHSLQCPLHQPLSEALWKSCGAWHPKCEKSTSTNMASRQCRFILQIPRCRIASHVWKLWLHGYYLWYWQSLVKSGCPNLATKSAQNQWQVAPSVEDPESKLGSETNRKRIYANICKHPIDEFKKIYRNYNHTKTFACIKCFCCQRNLIETFCPHWL